MRTALSIEQTLRTDRAVDAQQTIIYVWVSRWAEFNNGRRFFTWAALCSIGESKPMTNQQNQCLSQISARPFHHSTHFLQLYNCILFLYWLPNSCCSAVPAKRYVCVYLHVFFPIYLCCSRSFRYCLIHHQLFDVRRCIAYIVTAQQRRAPLDATTHFPFLFYLFIN